MMFYRIQIFMLGNLFGTKIANNFSTGAKYLIVNLLVYSYKSKIKVKIKPFYS